MVFQPILIISKAKYTGLFSSCKKIVLRYSNIRRDTSII